MKTVRRSLVGTLLISILSLNMIVTDYKSVVHAAKSEFKTGMNPGMAIRLEQQTVEAMKRAMQEFLPNYVQHDIGLPKTAEYAIRPWDISWLSWEWNWTDITYSQPNFDIKDIVFLMVNKYDEPMLKIDFPSLKQWKINAMETRNSWILPANSFIELDI